MTAFVSSFRPPPCGQHFREMGDRFGVPRILPSPPFWSALALCAVLTAGCSTPQPVVPVAAPAPAPAPVGEPVCEPCVPLKAQIARQQRELAVREAELSDLRLQRIEQARALEDLARQTARTQARPKRLATRVIAASYMAEVEVALTSAWSAPRAQSAQARLAQAQELLDSSKEPFAQGDYDGAIDRASQAADMIAKALEVSVRPLPNAQVVAVSVAHFAKPTDMRVKGDSNVREGPSPKAAVRSVLRAGTVVTAHARRGDWIRVVSADGRSGWVYGPLLAPR